MKNQMNAVGLKLGIGAAALCAVSVQAAFSIADGDSLVINGNISSYETTGYINNGQGGNGYDNVYSGALAVNVTDTTQSEKQSSILTFCTDVGEDWQYGNQNYTAKPFVGQDGVNPAWSASPQSIQNASYIYNNIFVPLVNANTLNANEASGVQLAIWKVLYDTGTSGLLSSTTFSSGKFLAYGFGNMAMADALNYLTDVDNARNGGTFITYSDTWLDPNNGNSQGLIWNASTPIAPNTSSVPEPTTVFAAALLLLPLGASAIRILRKSKNN